MSLIHRFVPLFFAVTCVCGIIFLVAQQNIRSSANELQLQLAEDIAALLSTQDDTFQITSLPRVNIRSSLAPFVIIFNADGKPISSSGELDGDIPLLPSGVFAYAKEHTDDRITWQPINGVRIAAVVKHFGGRSSGYVLAGRSLREIEKREDSLLQQVLIGWVVTVIITFLTILITTSDRKKKNNQR